MDTNESYLLTAVALAAVILLMLVAILAWAAIRFAKRKSEIEKQSLLAGIQIQEKERERIAVDLHDELGSLVSAIKIYMQRGDMDTADRLIDSTVGKVREIANDLSPRTLQLKGLLYATKEFAHIIASGKGIRIDFNPGDEKIDLPDSLQLQVYRILQEILHNAVKHSGAATIAIAVQLQHPLLDIRIRDDGKGFDKTANDTTRVGHGLANITTRVNILGGKLAVDSTQGKGVDYHIIIPVA